jgi:hypothetical protein
MKDGGHGVIVVTNTVISGVGAARTITETAPTWA